MTIIVPPTPIPTDAPELKPVLWADTVGVELTVASVVAVSFAVMVKPVVETEIAVPPDAVVGVATVLDSAADASTMPEMLKK
jgi:hypothetical protein